MVRTESPLKRIRDISNITPTSSPTSTPKKQKLQSTYNTYNTPTNTPGSSLFQSKSTVYTRAKSLFQRGSKNSPVLVSRENEAACLCSFIKDHICSNTPASLYISGPPGTGKTAQINATFQQLRQNHSLSNIFNPSDDISIENHTAKLVKINCMAISAPEHIFHEIYSHIAGKISISYTRKKTCADLKSLLNHQQPQVTKSFSSVVVVLDEMDSLITRDQQILFELFHMASPKVDTAARLILVGVSNALDLTDKFLPRLKRNGLHPQALPFLPYTFDQIKAVVVARLRSLNEEEKENDGDVGDIPIFHPAAIQLCCKKAASVTGDLRKAFDLAYKSIEAVEESVRHDKNIDIASLTPSNCPKVSIPHVARVCLASFTQNRVSNLNLLQKVVLCCLFRYQAQETGDITVNLLYEFYIKQSCVEKLMGLLKRGEFWEIISALESASAVTLGEKRGLKAAGADLGNKLIKTNVPYDDLVKSIGDMGVLKSILQC